eukprot:784437-Rhodomonas_salina.1
MDSYPHDRHSHIPFNLLRKDPFPAVIESWLLGPMTLWTLDPTPRNTVQETAFLTHNCKRPESVPRQDSRPAEREREREREQEGEREEASQNLAASYSGSLRLS